MDVIPKCYAPCIVNTAAGFHVFSCEKERGHQGDHFHEVLDVVNNVMGTLTWLYLGKAEDGDSWARSLSELCEVWIHPACPPKLHNEGVTRGSSYDHLVFVQDPTNDSRTGFCCGLSPKHSGRHVRSGTFGPLGIKWQIIW